MISIICAMDERRGIGKEGDLLFKIPEDFARMKKLTSGHTIIMGRKTYESIGRALPNRTNIVITRDENFKLGDPNIIIVHSLKEAIEKAKSAPGSEEIFIFGGGQIFKEALPLTDKLYLTIVSGDFGADTFFPDYSDFKKVVYEKKSKDKNYSYTFLELSR